MWGVRCTHGFHLNTVTARRLSHGCKTAWQCTPAHALTPSPQHCPPADTPRSKTWHGTLAQVKARFSMLVAGSSQSRNDATRATGGGCAVTQDGTQPSPARRNHKAGTRVRTASADGGFEVTSSVCLDLVVMFLVVLIQWCRSGNAVDASGLVCEKLKHLESKVLDSKTEPRKHKAWLLYKREASFKCPAASGGCMEQAQESSRRSLENVCFLER